MSSKVYSRIFWEDDPSTKTPLDADDLNIQDKGIDDIDNKLCELDERLQALEDDSEFDSHGAVSCIFSRDYWHPILHKEFDDGTDNPYLKDGDPLYDHTLGGIIFPISAVDLQNKDSSGHFYRIDIAAFKVSDAADSIYKTGINDSNGKIDITKIQGMLEDFKNTSASSKYIYTTTFAFYADFSGAVPNATVIPVACNFKKLTAQRLVVDLYKQDYEAFTNKIYKKGKNKGQHKTKTYQNAAAIRIYDSTLYNNRNKLFNSDGTFIYDSKGQPKVKSTHFPYSYFIKILRY